MDTRNIQDKYKWWDEEDIIGNLDESRSRFIAIFMNVDGDFNLSSGIRNLNWFNGLEVWIVGNKKWDRRGAVGTHNYMNIMYARTWDSPRKLLASEGYTIVAAEIDERAISLPTYQWNEKTAVIFGEEGLGLSEEILTSVDDIVYIPGRGSVRSLNVATTSGIFLYDYHMKLGLI